MKKWKLMLCAVLAGLLMMAWTAHADGEIKVVIEGQEVKFDKSPVADQGTTLVPFRVLFEKLGLAVDWIGETKTIIGKGEGVTIELQLDRKAAVINGETVELSVAPRAIDGSTYVPLRFVGEATGRDVKWDGATRTITIGAAPSTGLDPETFYRIFVEANNAEDLETVRSAIHPESPILAAFEAEAANSFENYDVVTTIEQLEVIEASDKEAVLHTIEKTVNTNGRFYMNNRSEQVLSLLKDDNGDWKIFNLQILGINFLIEEEVLKGDAKIDADVKEAVLGVINANIEATVAEDLKAYMDTIDPSSPAYAQSQEIMSTAFLMYDIDYEVEYANVIEVTDSRAYVYTVLTGKKIDGPEFQDNRTGSIHELRKQEDGSWKIYTSYLLSAEPLE